MQNARTLFSLMGPNSEIAELGRAERAFISAQGALLAVACVAAWGGLLGAATHTVTQNATLVPVLLIASSIAALPFGLFLWRIFGRNGRVSDLVVAHTTGAFAGAAGLVLLAPLVALYQHSSSFVGHVAAPASAAFGLTLGAFVFLRTLSKLAATPEKRRSVLVPTAAVLVLQVASLAQLASVLPPLFGTRTTFGRGVDAVMTAPEAR